MVDASTRLRLDYAPLMMRYLARRDESGLKSAYELGRDAMRESVSLLEVVRVHNEIFLEILATVRDLEEAKSVSRSAAALLLDLVAAFEMSQRGFMDVRLGRDQEAGPD